MRRIIAAEYRMLEERRQLARKQNVTTAVAVVALAGSVYGAAAAASTAAAVATSGAAMAGAGYTVHVGSKNSYVAVYSGARPDQIVPKRDASYMTRGGLNHIGVVVDDLDAVEAKVIAMGLTPKSHADYEPGRRFYFDDPDGVEIEVISYA